MKHLTQFILAGSILAYTFNAVAAGMPTCATIAKLDNKPVPNILTVVIDQTTLVDDNLINKFKTIASNAINDGTQVKVYTFSAFSQGEYFKEIFRATRETPLTKDERYNIPKKQLTIYDRCLRQQAPAITYQIENSITEAMQNARADLAKSDIAYNLSKVAATISHDLTGSNNVLIFSDMLENSSITSFYKRGKVREVYETDLEKMKNSGISANFSGANIYVMGAGLISEKGQKRGIYRDPMILNSIENFWVQWFASSDGTVKGFGMPELQTGIQ